MKFLMVYQILLWLFWHEIGYGRSQVVTNDNCDANSTNCVVNCDSCGAEIHCPSTSDCNSCVINCMAGASCKDSEIFGYSCRNVIINCEVETGRGAALENAIIHAPNNNGNITLNSSSGDCFKRSHVIASDSDMEHGYGGTGRMLIDCNNTYDNNECKEIFVNATQASTLEFICNGGAKCELAEIYCPDNDYTVDGEWGTPCMVDCSDTGGATKTCISMSVYTKYGLNYDLTWICDETNKDGCKSSTIFCGLNEYKDGKCDWSYSNDDWSCDGSCYYSIAPTTDPTYHPTYHPTHHPTVKPSLQPNVEPTHKPSMLPTIPTMLPTMLPTNLPSYNPTANPTANPTMNPTMNPSSNPTNNPINNPTTMPSVIPSLMPSLIPTENPSVKPSRLPSNNPTMNPTNMPSINPSMDPSWIATLTPSLVTTQLQHNENEDNDDNDESTVFSTNIHSTEELVKELITNDRNDSFQSELLFIAIIIILGGLFLALFICLIGILMRQMYKSNSKIENRRKTVDTKSGELESEMGMGMGMEREESHTVSQIKEKDASGGGDGGTERQVNSSLNKRITNTRENSENSGMYGNSGPVNLNNVSFSTKQIGERTARYTRRSKKTKHSKKHVTRRHNKHLGVNVSDIGGYDAPGRRISTQFGQSPVTRSPVTRSPVAASPTSALSGATALCAMPRSPISPMLSPSSQTFDSEDLYQESFTNVANVTNMTNMTSRSKSKPFTVTVTDVDIAVDLNDRDISMAFGNNVNDNASNCNTNTNSNSFAKYTGVNDKGITIARYQSTSKNENENENNIDYGLADASQNEYFEKTFNQLIFESTENDINLMTGSTDRADHEPSIIYMDGAHEPQTQDCQDTIIIYQ